MAKEYKSEGAVFRLLERRYPESQYAIFSQVADETGARQSRWADAIAFGLWPSRGLEIEGFEIKVSRSDWLSELKDPSKSSAIQRYCHRWWIVAGSRKIIKPEEIPKSWGLLIPRGNDMLEAKVPAPLLTPKKISRKFCAAVMRRAAEGHQRTLRNIKDELYKEAKDKAEEIAVLIAKREIDEELIEAKMEISRRDGEIRRLKHRLNQYEKIESAAGVKLSQINFPGLLNNLSQRALDAESSHIEGASYRIKKAIEDLEGLLERADKIAPAISEIVANYEPPDESGTSGDDAS